MRNICYFLLIFVVTTFPSQASGEGVVLAKCDGNNPAALDSCPDQMLNPIPMDLLVPQAIKDSDALVVHVRCVVHCKFSERELANLEKNSRDTVEWARFYEDYLFYNEDVSMFLYERALVKTESQKRYVQFIGANGSKVVIDRKKSAGKLFFFNPATGVQQCDAACFDRRKYKNF